MEFKIRTISENDGSLLEDFLYEAIFIPPGVSKPPKSIINRPELQVYIENFGTKKDDLGLVAEVDGKPIGAVWARIMDDYGHVDDDTPSSAISLFEKFRGLGIGSALMEEMLRVLKDEGYKQVSLSVQKENYAARLYQKIGFEIIDENEEEFIMLFHL